MDTTRRISCDHDGCCTLRNSSLVFPDRSYFTEFMDSEQGWEEACWSSFTHGFGKLVLGKVTHLKYSKQILILHSALHKNGIVHT